MTDISGKYRALYHKYFSPRILENYPLFCILFLHLYVCYNSNIRYFMWHHFSFSTGIKIFCVVPYLYSNMTYWEYIFTYLIGWWVLLIWNIFCSFTEMSFFLPKFLSLIFFLSRYCNIYMLDLLNYASIFDISFSFNIYFSFCHTYWKISLNILFKL